MKNYLKENIKNLPFILVAFIMFYGITTLATNYLFNSNEVSYDNTETGLHADEVQGAIDEVFQHATDYSELKTKIGTNTLTTTSQTLIGGINEVNEHIVSLENPTSVFQGRITSTSYTSYTLSQDISNKKLIILIAGTWSNDEVSHFMPISEFKERNSSVSFVSLRPVSVAYSTNTQTVTLYYESGTKIKVMCENAAELYLKIFVI